LEFQVRLQAVDRYIKQWIQRFNAPGLTVAVTDRARLIWGSTWGRAEVDLQTPVTGDTLFEIGSLGKPLTNIVLLQLREKGQFDLHAPISRYLPWFQVQSEFPPIAAHHLMSQTGGIVQGTGLAPHGLYESWSLRNTRAGAAPGELCSYSNVGYQVLGFLVEKLTGQSLPDAIQQRVLTPLGMDQTSAAITFDSRQRTATGYACRYDDRPEHPSYGLVPSIWSEYGTGDGCQASTAADMARYLRMLLNRGNTPDGPLISEESFGLLTQQVIWTGTDYYGYGLAMYPEDGRFLIGHGGATAGFTSAILLDMEAGLGAVALVNLAGEPDAVLSLLRYVLPAARAVQRQEELPPPPPTRDPSYVDNGNDYAGSYRSGSQTIQFTAGDSQLLLHHDGQLIALETRARDSFYVPQADFALFLLEFQREAGAVVEAFHGGRYYINQRYSGPRTFDYPEVWNAYPGHYRARSPRFSNFRIIIRKGALFLVYAVGTVESLIPLGDALFRIGSDQRLPDTLRFDAIVDGRALLADYCGCPYFRAFTP
jgi:CubicO group peptidase (beta-lactamase class C family)